MKERMLSGVVTIGERGQVVIPAEIRESLGLKPGEKLLVFTPKENMICLVEPEQFERHFQRMVEQLSTFRNQFQKDNSQT